MHFNENSDRSIATTQEGVERHCVKYPKYKKGGHVVKRIMEDPTHSEFVAHLFISFMSLRHQSVSIVRLSFIIDKNCYDVCR